MNAPVEPTVRHSMHPQVGQLIHNKYRLVRLIGAGGMGSVWEATHELLGTNVALKFLHAELAKRKGLVERFLQEAQVSARIKSPHVVRVADVDRTSEGLAFMVMDLIEGNSLQHYYEQLHDKGEKLGYGAAFEVMLQLLEGVAAAHRLGIVHRDLKPDNVMLSIDSKGRTIVKILDFGIAKLKASGEADRGLTRPGVVMGTPEYMAPEQALSSDRVDGRADIFSLGVMFFEMLAGRRPVGGDNAHAIAAQYLEGQFPRLPEIKATIAEDLAAAVHKAMAAKPEDRFQSVDEFQAAIEPFVPEGSRRQVGLTPPEAADATNTPGAAKIAKTVAPEQPPALLGGDEQRDAHAALRDAPHDLEQPAAARPPMAAPADAASDPRLDDPIQKAAAPEQAARVGTQPVLVVPMMGSLLGGSQPSFSLANANANPTPPAVAKSSDPTLRPGGTQLGDGASPFSAVPATEGMPHGADAGLRPPGYGRDYQPAAGMPPFVPAVAVPRGHPTKSGPSFLAILGIATLLSGLAVGGVFLAHRISKDEDVANDPLPPRRSEPSESQPPATSDPPPPVATVPATVLPPPPPPTNTTPPPSNTNPRPSNPTPTAPPTATQTNPPWILPTALPTIPGIPTIPGLTFPPTPTPPPETPPPPAPPPPPGGRFPRIPRPNH